MPMDQSDKLQTHIDRPYATPEVHARAYACLQRRHAEGTLPHVEDGTGDPVTDYVNILGINYDRISAPR